MVALYTSETGMSDGGFKQEQLLMMSMTVVLNRMDGYRHVQRWFSDLKSFSLSLAIAIVKKEKRTSKRTSRRIH